MGVVSLGVISAYHSVLFNISIAGCIRDCGYSSGDFESRIHDVWWLTCDARKYTRDHSERSGDHHGWTVVIQGNLVSQNIVVRPSEIVWFEERPQLDTAFRIPQLRLRIQLTEP
jgi:hypothetical protein